MSDNGVQDALPEAPTFDAIGEAKLLLRTTRWATLATVIPDSGHPFATLVNVANAPDGSPIVLLSQLAAHRRHLAADARLSLLFYVPGRGDPLAHPRLTILGRAERVDDPVRRGALRARFLARHPEAALYADFPDFAFFHVEMENLHLNGGFGRAAPVTVAQIRTSIAGADALIAAEIGALDHMREDHPAFAGLLADAHGNASAHAQQTMDGGPWRIAGIDPDGIDLANDAEIRRVPFARRITSPAELRQTLIELGDAARHTAQTRK